MEKPTPRSKRAPTTRGARSASARRYASRTARRTVHRSAKTGRIGRVGLDARHAPTPAVPRGAEKRPFEPGGFGCAEGAIWIAPDFDDPIEDFDLDS